MPRSHVLDLPGQRTALAVALVLILTAAPARAQELVLTLPEEPGPHWFWLEDLMLHRSALFDADTGDMLGMVSAGLGVIAPSFAPERRELYLPETHYSRGTRGERTDVVTVYDTVTLSPVAEIPIPPKRAEYVSGVATSALSDDRRFLAVFNLTPATSLSIVDVVARELRADILTPGCSLVYPAGERRFLMLCGDGALLSVTIDDEGHALDLARGEPFFDPKTDPVTEKAVRYRDEWRIGGAQHLAVHEGTGRLYALMHQGGEDTHKEPGTEVWVYDLASRERVQRIELRNASVAFVAGLFGLGPGGFWGWLLDAMLPNAGADRIAVTRDADPRLLAPSSFPASISVYDARSGAFVRAIDEVGFAAGLIVAP